MLAASGAALPFLPAGTCSQSYLHCQLIHLAELPRSMLAEPRAVEVHDQTSMLVPVVRVSIALSRRLPRKLLEKETSRRGTGGKGEGMSG